jgi:hypothetical protein
MMMFRTRIATAGTALALISAVGILPGAASANAAPVSTAAVPHAQPAATTLPVMGTLPDGSTFTGQLSNLSTSVVNGVLTLAGTITGTGVPGDTPFSAPVQNLTTANGCTLLTLDLGPLHLDVLGLVVDLAPVKLDLTAVPGAGNLLGNLLCAVAGLLDRGGPLQGLSALLNRLLTGLGL